MRHAKRQKLTTDDVNHALRVRNLEVRSFAQVIPVKQSLLGVSFARAATLWVQVKGTSDFQEDPWCWLGFVLYSGRGGRLQ